MEGKRSLKVKNTAMNWILSAKNEFYRENNLLDKVCAHSEVFMSILQNFFWKDLRIFRNFHQFLYKIDQNSENFRNFFTKIDILKKLLGHFQNNFSHLFL